MKKICISIIIVLIVTGVGFLIYKSNKEDIPITEAIKETFTGSDSNNSEVTNDGFTFIGYDNTNYHDKGYFYISENLIEGNLKYFDYETRQEIYLCNKPNCNHNNNTCSSYLEEAVASRVFVINNQVYLIDRKAVMDRGEEQDDESFTMTPVKGAEILYRMNLDGTGKEEVLKIPSGVNLEQNMVVKGDFLYVIFNTISNGNSTISKNQELVKINLKNGKYEKLIDAKNKMIIGGYNNTIILLETVYKENPDKYINNNDGYINNLLSSNVVVKGYSIDTKKEEEIYKLSYQNIESYAFYKNTLYFTGRGLSEISSLNISNGEISKVVDVTNNMDIYGIRDDKIIYHTYESKNSNAYYYYDLKTKENKELNMFTNQGSFVRILASNKDYYFVLSGYIMGSSHTTWAGTEQISIEGREYSLIKKDDYWNDKKNYIKMKNTN